MDNLRVITVLGAFGGGVQGGGSGGSSDAPVGTADLTEATHICHGKRYILSASDLMESTGCTTFDGSELQVCNGAQAEIWVDNTGDRVKLYWPSQWLWPKADGVTYELAGCTNSDVNAAETQCGYVQVVTVRHDGQAILANLAYQYMVDGIICCC